MACGVGRPGRFSDIGFVTAGYAPRAKGAAFAGYLHGISMRRKSDGLLGGKDRRGSRGVDGQQLTLSVDRSLIRPPPDPFITAVGLQFPRLGVVAQAKIQIPHDPLAMHIALDREGDLHAPEKIALHPVGTGAKHLRLTAILETKHA